MNIQQSWFTILYTVIQTYALLLFFSRMFRDKRPFLHRKWVYLLVDLGLSGVIFCLRFYLNDSHMAVSIGYTVIVQMMVCVALFEGDRWYQLFYILFANVYFYVFTMFSLLFSAKFYVPLPNLNHFTYGIAVSFLFQIAALILLWQIQRYSLKNIIRFPPPRAYWLLIYLIFLALFFSCIYMTDTLTRRNLVSGLSVLVEFVFLLMCVAFYIMFLKICRGYEEEMINSVRQQQYELQKKHFAEVNSSNNVLKKLRHELKNFVLYMNYLIDKKDYNQLKEFFSDFYEKEYHNLLEVSVSDNLADVVIQQKETYAHSLGVEISCQQLYESNTGIDDIDLCVLLSNLLDNAIEACRNQQDALISVRIRRIKEYLSVVIENTTDHDVLADNPDLLTSKQSREIHGFGLQVIRQIVDKYDGSIRYESSDRLFSVMLMLRIPELNSESIQEDKAE